MPHVRAGLAISLIVTVALLALAAFVAWRLFAFAAFSAPPPEAAGPTRTVGIPARLGRLGVPLRITLLGTSLTARGDWPRRLEAALAACRDGGAEVRVVARAGAASPWGLSVIAAEAARRPDMLVLEFSINDASLARGVSVARAGEVLEAMLTHARAEGVPVLLATMNPAWGREAWERPGQTAYRELYRASADAGRAALLDTVPAWRALSETERTHLVPDGLHPTPDGMVIIHLPALTAALSSAACRPEIDGRN